MAIHVRATLVPVVKPSTNRSCRFGCNNGTRDLRVGSGRYRGERVEDDGSRWVDLRRNIFFLGCKGF